MGEIKIDRNAPKPGELIPWEEREGEIKEIMGDKQIIQKEWKKIEETAYKFVWGSLID